MIPSRRNIAPGPAFNAALWQCAAALLLSVLALSGCAGVGPSALSNGRPAYNEVINATEDQQTLSMIVRQRYDETFGMLAVSSVTASLRVGASVGANVGIGPRSGYEGNLVPFSAGAMYEDNPTISYVPVRGERFIERMLAPISAEQVLLLSRMSTDEVEVLKLLVRRANGMVNPLYSSQPASGEAFARFVELYVRLRERGRLDIVRMADGQFQVLLHDYSEEDSPAISDLFQTLGIHPAREARGPIAVPLRFFVGSPQANGIDFETPSALEIIGAAAAGVDVPTEHISDGLALATASTARHDFIIIHSSQERPAHASVAVMHRDWWFYIDGRDARSKQAFVFLRTLIGLRLDEASSSLKAPVLTVPASR
ncbi:MAG: hypothetical protein ACREJO_15630 [Phycisphaerales bacterium]